MGKLCSFYAHIICSFSFLTSGIWLKNQQSIGSTASGDNHDERVKAYESARALYLSHSRFSSRNMKEEEYHIQEKVYAWDRGALYEAKVLKCKETDDGLQYFIHYL